MTHQSDDPLAALDGPATVPQQRHTLLFDATWEANAFAIALALHEAHALTWNAFRDRLIVEIAEAETHGRPSSYYERWLAALERLLVEQGLLDPAELDARTAEPRR
jgi:nitrile hydratase accessory protein